MTYPAEDRSAGRRPAGPPVSEPPMTGREREVAAAGLHSTLTIALEAAVPLWIAELRGTTDEQRRAMAARDAAIVAAHGDDILFRGSRRGDTAKAFNALARGLAVCAYQPGGVAFAGLRWCARHPADRRRASDGPVCPRCLAEERAARRARPGVPG